MRALGLAPLAGLLLAALLAAPAAAQPYRWVDEQGNVHYADRPPQPPPPTLENLNPAARQRRAAPPVVEPAPGQPAPEPPAASPTPTPPSAPTQPPTPATVQTRRAPSASAPPTAQGRIREDRRGVAREIMDLAGIDRYLEDLARTAQGDLARLAWSTRDPNAAWAALVPVLRRDVITGATAAALARRIDSEHLPALLAWLRSPEHLKLRQAEREAAQPASQHLYRRFVASLAEPNAKIPNLSSIQQLERAGRGPERHVALEHALRLAMQRAVAPLVRRPPGDEDDDVRPRAEERVRFWLLTASLFAYRGLGSAHIEAAIRFERSAAGLWFTAIAWESLEEAVTVVEQRAAAAVRAITAHSMSSPERVAGTGAHQ